MDQTTEAVATDTGAVVVTGATVGVTPANSN